MNLHKQLRLHFCFVICLFFTINNAFSTTYNFVGGGLSRSWADSSSWSPAGIPGPNDDVVFNVAGSDVISIPGDVTVRSLNILGLGNISGSGTLTITESLNAGYPVTFQINVKLGYSITLLFLTCFPVSIFIRTSKLTGL
jgi:hypothetical protein